MHIRIVAVGMRMPGWVNQGVAEYQKRFPPEIKPSLVEVPAARRSRGADSGKTLKLESERIRAALPKVSRLIVLDEHGKKQDTRSLAGQLTAWMQDGGDISLLIGGADGLHGELKQAAEERWSLSDLTLPHGLARVLLMEQLYRAWSITRHHPYHRE